MRRRRAIASMTYAALALVTLTVSAARVDAVAQALGPTTQPNVLWIYIEDQHP